MIPQLIKLVRMYRSDVEGRLSDLRADEITCPDDDDVKAQIAHWEATLEMIDQGLAVPANLEEGTRLVAATFLIALDKETSPEPMDELGDILAELVQIDVDVEGTGRTCQAAEIRDACDVTELVVSELYAVFQCPECNETCQWPHSKLDDGTPQCTDCGIDMKVVS